MGSIANLSCDGWMTPARRLGSSPARSRTSADRAIGPQAIDRPQALPSSLSRQSSRRSRSAALQAPKSISTDRNGGRPRPRAALNGSPTSLPRTLATTSAISRGVIVTRRDGGHRTAIADRRAVALRVGASVHKVVAVEEFVGELHERAARRATVGPRLLCRCTSSSATRRRSLPQHGERHPAGTDGYCDDLADRAEAISAGGERPP